MFQNHYLKLDSPRVSSNLNKSAPNFSPVSIVKGCGEKIAALRTSETLEDPSSHPTDFFSKFNKTENAPLFKGKYLDKHCGYKSIG